MLDKSLPHIGVLMVKTDTQNFPRFALPTGFSLCGWRPGLEDAWATLMFVVDQTDTLQEAQAYFQTEFMTRPELLPTHCLFVLDEAGEVAACGSLWPGRHFGRDMLRLHWIATTPQYQGRGLAKALLTELLARYQNEKSQEFLYLTSQTWSWKALHLYAKLDLSLT